MAHQRPYALDMSAATGTHRDYAGIVRAFPKDLRSRSRDERMQAVVDALWESLHAKGVSWVGFYIDQLGQPDADRMVLGPRRDKPACSPIGLHGACGQALLSEKVLIVRDVAELGPNYIACDPRDKSEIVLPLIDEAGTCWGVLDVDSWDVGAFDERDAEGLAGVLRAAGFQPFAA